MPLLPSGTREQRRELAESRYQLKPLDANASLAAMLDGPDQWVRACALYVVGRQRARAFSRQVQAGLEARDPRVRDTAEWASQTLAGATP